MALIVSPGQNEIEQMKKHGFDIAPHRMTRHWTRSSRTTKPARLLARPCRPCPIGDRVSCLSKRRRLPALAVPGTVVAFQSLDEITVRQLGCPCAGSRALTNGFSKKVENHEHAVALHFMHYNFCRIHQSLRVTPAMEAGISDHVWSLAEVVEMIDRESN